VPPEIEVTADGVLISLFSRNYRCSLRAEPMREAVG